MCTRRTPKSYRIATARRANGSRFTWCDEQQHEQQDRGPQLPGFPYGLQLIDGWLIHFGGDGSSDGFVSSGP
jgi:hypothetical protein